MASKRSLFLARFLVALTLLFICSIVVYRTIDPVALGFDDAHIFFAYGQNIARGLGPVYNAGGEFVEGFSSPLWTLFIAFGYTLTERPEPMLFVICLLLTAAAIALIWNLVEEKFLSWRGLLLIVWTLGTPLFVGWFMLALMETALWTAIIALSLVVALAISASYWAIILMIALLLFVRPEGMIWAPLILAVWAINQAFHLGWVRTRHLLWRPLVGYLAILGAITAARILLFGYPLPNTYYAKVGDDQLYNLQQGALYLVEFLIDNKLAVLVISVVVTGLILNGKWFIANLVGIVRSKGTVCIQTDHDERRFRFVIYSLVALTALLVPVLEGGDHFRPYYRFYLASWPLLILPVIGLIDVAVVQRKQLVGYAVCILILLGFVTLPRETWLNQHYTDSFRVALADAHAGEQLGSELNDIFPDPKPSVGVVAAGGVAVSYSGPVIDLMGLNNVAMAHSSGDRRGWRDHAAFDQSVFYQQEPDILIPTIANQESLRSQWQNGDQYKLYDSVLKGLLSSERFREQYALVVLSAPEQSILTWGDREYLEQMAGQDVHIEYVELME